VTGAAKTAQQAHAEVMTVAVLFLVAALVLFALAAFKVTTPRVDLGWAGMVFLTVAIWLIPALH
jgi:hypothetical protein